MGLWLTEDELAELTGYKTAKRQKMALGRVNIPFRSRDADGFPLVDRWRFEGEIIRPQPRRKQSEPDFSSLYETPKKKTPRE